MIVRFYDDEFEGRPIPRSLFLAGPTVRGLGRTPWRAEALQWLEARGFDGTVLVPEFQSGRFEELAPKIFGSVPSPVPGMRAIGHGVLSWETTGIEQVTVVLFWMPFHITAKDDPASLPGFTTRAEVSRELARDATRVVLGMPHTAFSSGHIRYHAHRAGLPIYTTLQQTLEVAIARFD